MNELSTNADALWEAFKAAPKSTPVESTEHPGFVPLRQRIQDPQGRIDYGWNDEMRRRHLTSAYARGWKQFPLTKAHPGTFIICGGGPSLSDTLGELRRLARKENHYVFAVNKTHDFLLNLEEKGLGQNVPVWGAALLDPCDWVKDYITPRDDVQYFIADQCAPETFDVFDKAGLTKWIWSAINMNKDRDIIPKHMAMIFGGSTIAQRAIILGYYMGFRKFRMFGVDSSCRVSDDRPEGALHAYEKKDSVGDRVKVKAIDEHGLNIEFVSNTHMARQAQEFIETMTRFQADIDNGQMQPISMKVHGDGLLPTIAARMGLHANPERNLKC